MPAPGQLRRYNRNLERHLSAATDLLHRLSSESEALQREFAEQADSQLQAVLDHVKDAILTVDESGSIDLFNPTAERLFGYAAPEVQGRPLSGLLPALFTDTVSVVQVLETLAADREDTQLDLAAHATRGLRRDGREFDAEFAVSEARLQHERVFIVCLRDVSDRTTRALADAMEKRLLEKFAVDAPLEAVLEAMLAAVASATPQWRFAVQYLEPASGTLIHGVAPQLAREFVMAMDGIPVEEPGFGSCAAALQADEEVWMPDVATELRWTHRAAAAAMADIGCAWSAPLRGLGGEILGVIVAYGASGGVLGDRDRELFARLTRLAALAIERHRHQQQIRDSKRAVQDEKDRAQVTLQSIGDAVISTDADGIIDYLNPAAAQLTGWDVAAAAGQPLSLVFPLVHELTGEALPPPLRQPLEEGTAWTAHDQVALRRRDGQPLGVQCTANPIRDQRGQVAGAVVVFRDVSRERRLRRALSYQASHDTLTGLINRREFEAKLHFLMEATRGRADRRHALVYVDLDQFKVVNDTCGHPAGDRLLKQVTLLLQTRVRTRDVLARLGGDEFGLLLEDCGLDQAVNIAENIRQAIREFRFVSGPHALNIGASIGVVEINSRSESAASVMSAVDVACYTAKEGGRDRIHVYRAGEVPQRHREMQWVSRVQRAADEGRFELYCQRIQAVSPLAVEHDGGHYELLVRMRDEEGRLVQPGEFIPAAERYNLMPVIDRWAIREALRRFAARQGSGQRHSLALNLSGTTLNDERFLEFLMGELDQVALEPGALCFEITETAAITNMANVVYFMRQLKSRGVRFALDDFGSGLSSFSYLKTLPVDILKIDGQFVENVVRDPVDRSMVSAICQVARTMGLVTCAERVETPEALEVLAQLGIDYAQGYLFGQPAPASAMLPGLATIPAVSDLPAAAS